MKIRELHTLFNRVEGYGKQQDGVQDTEQVVVLAPVWCWRLSYSLNWTNSWPESQPKSTCQVRDTICDIITTAPRTIL